MGIQRPLVICALLLCASGMVPAQPHVEVVPDTLDFGTVRPRNFVQGEVSIVNRGEDTLRISGFNTSCGCVDAVPDMSRIGYLEAATLRVSVNIQNRLGSVWEWVKIDTNDPKRPHLLLAFHVFIVPPDSTDR